MSFNMQCYVFFLEARVRTHILSGCVKCDAGPITTPYMLSFTSRVTLESPIRDMRKPENSKET